MTDDIDCSAMLNYNPNDPKSVLELQLFISRNHSKMAKLSLSGRAKMREAEDTDRTIFKEYCELYGVFCYPTNTAPETIENYCSKNLDCGNKNYFNSISQIGDTD